MRCIKFFIICIFVFQCNCFSQENLKDFSIEDSTSYVNPINKNDLKLGLEFYSKAINDSTLILQQYSLDLMDYPKEELESFKESFSLLMELAKKDLNKYDLGFVTEYLGISQQVMAIILAIISVAK